MGLLAVPAGAIVLYFALGELAAAPTPPPDFEAEVRRDRAEHDTTFEPPGGEATARQARAATRDAAREQRIKDEMRDESAQCERQRVERVGGARIRIVVVAALFAPGALAAWFRHPRAALSPGRALPQANASSTRVAMKIRAVVVALLLSTVGGTVQAAPGCPSATEVRFYHWAWNAQMGLMLATGGKEATADSLMCKNGVGMKLVREDNTDTMQSLLVTFAEGLKNGEANPKNGAHFVAIMGDGAAMFLKGLNDRLTRLGPEYQAAIVGSAGFSRGEDKFMGPAAWKADPKAARGGLVAGVLRDGDWNIAMKWLGDHKIANNPDEKTYDPDALNWINATDYIDAAQKYVSGYCAELKNTRTGKQEKHCVDGVVTWTPGDVTVAEKKGGLVSIVSTKEYAMQMPNVIIGNKKWMAANPKVVTGMLDAIFTAGAELKKNPAALQKAAAISATVYNERDAAYWAKYFRPVVEKDKTGATVQLGGSTVNDLADNLRLFGLLGKTNYFGITYQVFGDIVKSQYPQLLPSYYPASAITDLTYLKSLRGK